MSAGRRAALPRAGYAMPLRLFISEDECRVRLFPENGGRPADIDLSVLPVPPQLQAWFAVAVAGVTGPGGTRRSLRSGLDTLSILKRFTRFLAGLDQPPQSPDQLTAAHVSGFILAGGPALHRDIPALRSILRFAQDPPAGFAARLAQASVPTADVPAVSYSPDEYQRIIAAARSQLRAAAARIASGRAELAAWRTGLIGQAAEPARWEAARLLDHADRRGDVPRRGNSQTRTYSAQCAGGAPAIIEPAAPDLPRSDSRVRAAAHADRAQPFHRRRADHRALPSRRVRRRRPVGSGGDGQAAPGITAGLDEPGAAAIRRRGQRAWYRPGRCHHGVRGVYGAAGPGRPSPRPLRLGQPVRLLSLCRRPGRARVPRRDPQGRAGLLGAAHLAGFRPGQSGRRRAGRAACLITAAAADLAGDEPETGRAHRDDAGEPVPGPQPREPCRIPARRRRRAGRPGHRCPVPATHPGPHLARCRARRR